MFCEKSVAVFAGVFAGQPIYRPYAGLAVFGEVHFCGVVAAIIDVGDDRLGLCINLVQKVKLLLRKLADVVGDEQKSAESLVDLGDKSFFGIGVFQVDLAHEEDVGIVAERAPVKTATENRILNRRLGGHDFVVCERVNETRFELNINVRADAAVIEPAERREQRHAATQNVFVAAAVAKEGAGVIHNLAAGFVAEGDKARRVQEVEFDHIVAPLVQNHVKEVADIVGALFDVKVEREARTSAKHARCRFAVCVFQNPVGMSFCHDTVLFDIEGRKPKSRLVSAFVDFVGDELHTVREFLFIGGQPVADFRLMAVVNLENVDFVRAGKTFKVAQDNLFVDFREVVVPARVARGVVYAAF